MSKTESDVVNQVRVLLNEPTGGYFDDSELTTWARDSVLDIASQLLCVESADTIDTVTGTLLYDLPDGGLKPVAVLHAGKALKRITAAQLGHVRPNADRAPEFWFPFARQVGVYPVPRTAFSLDVLLAKRTLAVTDLSDEYQPLAVLRTLAWALLKDRKYAAAREVMNIYLAAAGFMREEFIEREPAAKDQLPFADLTVGRRR